jgi:hypothetical protein
LTILNCLRISSVFFPLIIEATLAQATSARGFRSLPSFISARLRACFLSCFSHTGHGGRGRAPEVEVLSGRDF